MRTKSSRQYLPHNIFCLPIRTKNDQDKVNPHVPAVPALAQRYTS